MKPDALTRRYGNLPKEGGKYDECTKFQYQVVLKPQNVTELLDTVLTLACGQINEEVQQAKEAKEGADNVKTITKLFNEAYIPDPIPNNVLGQLHRGQTCSKQSLLAEYQVDDNGRLLYCKRIYVPNHMLLKLRLIRDLHEMPAAGHPGRSKTLELLAWHYYWLKMYKEVDRFVRNCYTCQRARTSRHAPFGVLCPMPIPDGAWHHILMDFIVSLPWLNGYNAILVVVCRLTKMQHFIPYRDTCTAEQLADLYVRNIFCLHGLPKTVISDQGMQFIAKFWKGLCNILKIEALLSTPYYPETNGQTERMNTILEQYLRAYINYLQDDWEA